MTDDVLPDPALLGDGPAALRVQATSKLAFGATTAALVTLASSGTAVLVSHGASSLQAPTALPPTTTLVDPAAARGAVVVDRAAGSYGQEAAPAEAPVAAPADPSVTALSEALARRPEPGRRTLTVPLVVLPVVNTPVVDTPVVEVPVVDVPVVTPAQPVTLPTVPAKPHKPAGGTKTPATPVTVPVVVPATSEKGDEHKTDRAAEIRAQLKLAERQKRLAEQAARRARHAAKAAKQHTHKSGDKGEPKASEKADKHRAKHSR